MNSVNSKQPIKTLLSLCLVLAMLLALPAGLRVQAAEQPDIQSEQSEPSAPGDDGAEGGSSEEDGDGGDNNETDTGDEENGGTSPGQNSGDDEDDTDTDETDEEDEDDLDDEDEDEEEEDEEEEEDDLLDTLTDAIDTYDTDYMLELIENASGTISLDGNFELDAPITIDEALTIEGNGHTITSTHGGRHFYVDSAAGYVTFLSLTLAAPSGGGIEATGGGALTIELEGVNASGLQNGGVNGGVLAGSGNPDLQFVLEISSLNGNAAANGGAIYNDAGTVQLNNNNTLDNNTATGNGGAVVAARLETTGGTMNGNTAGADGGAVYLQNGFAWDSGVVGLRMYATGMSGNGAARGGAVYIDSQAKTEIDYAVISGNTATAEGGGIYANTTNDNFSLSGVEIRGNGANLGGGVYTSPDVELTGGSVIDGNSAYQGGGIYTLSQANINGATISNNTATYQGGGIFNSGITDSDMTTVQNAELFGNRAEGDTGGAIFMYHFSRVYTMQCNFHDNYAYITAYWQHYTEAPLMYEHHPSNVIDSGIEYTTHTAPFPNILNGADISFDSEDSDNGQATVYEVNLITGGGAWSDGQTGDRVVRVPEDFALDLPFTVTKYGVAPEDWLYGGPSGPSYDFSQLVTGNFSLYAKWPSYTVDFVVDGEAMAGQNQTIELGDTATAPTFTKTRHTLNGWYTNSGLTEAYSFSAPVTANQTLYAQWVFDGYNVEYWVDGVRDDTYTTQTEDETLTAPDYTREGYTLDGWYTDDKYTQPYTFGETLNDDLQLYARWDFDGYTVEYIVDGKPHGSHTTDSETETLTPPDMGTKPGHEFNGWYTDPGLTQPYTFGQEVDKNLKLYGAWEAELYTVVFVEVDNRDGRTQMAKLTDVPYGTTIAHPTPVSRAGYVIADWYRDEAMTKAWNFDTDVVTDDITLYGAWKFIGFDVYFVVDGKVHEQRTGLAGGVKLLAPKLDEREGYAFTGWYRGTMEDIVEQAQEEATGRIAPVNGLLHSPVAAPTLSLTAVAPMALAAAVTPGATDEVELVYWDFDNDGMPEETLVLVASFTESAPLGAGGTGSGSSTSGGSSSSSSSSTANATANAGSIFYGGAKTADNTNIVLPVLLAGGAILALVAALYWRKRLAGK